MMRRLVILAGMSGLMAACADNSIDIGAGNHAGANSSGTGGTTSTGTPTPLPRWPDPNECVASSDLPITGTWNGYQENGAWDTLRLVIHGASETGGVCGTLTIGTGTPPPPATDPNVGYPPEGFPGLPPVTEGFAFTFFGGSILENRVRFVISYFEPWRGWCQLQRSFPVTMPGGEGQYSCVPYAYGTWNGDLTSNQCVYVNPATGERASVSCEKLLLCTSYQACACNASQCDGNPGGSYHESFDLHFDAAQADGSAYGGRIRFFRAE